MQEFFSTFNRLEVWLIQPIKLCCLFDTKRVKEEHCFSQITPLNFGCIAFWTVEVSTLSPEPVAFTRRCPSSSSFPLVSRCPAYGFEQESGNATLGIIACDSSDAAVYHMANAFNGDRRLGNVRGYHNFSK